MGKNYSNQRWFKKKTTKLNFQLAQHEKNKFNKDNFEKKLIKKNMWWNTVARQKSCGETLDVF